MTHWRLVLETSLRVIIWRSMSALWYSCIIEYILIWAQLILKLVCCCVCWWSYACFWWWLRSTKLVHWHTIPFSWPRGCCCQFGLITVEILFSTIFTIYLSFCAIHLLYAQSCLPVNTISYRFSAPEEHGEWPNPWIWSKNLPPIISFANIVLANIGLALLVQVFYSRFIFKGEF